MFIIYVIDLSTKNKNVGMRVHIFFKIEKIGHWKYKKKTFSYFISEIPNFSYMCFSEYAQCFFRAFFLILRKEKVSKLCVGHFNALHVYFSHTSMLEKQSVLGKDYLSLVKQLAEKLQKTDKPFTDRIDSFLCN